MKFVCQLDYPDTLYPTRLDMEGEEKEKGLKTTIKTSGCGLCSAVMIAERLIPENDFDLNAAMELSYAVKANRRIGTDFRPFVPSFAEKCGLDFEITTDPERLLHCLHTGGAAIVYARGDKEGRIGVFSHVEHYIVAISQERDGRIAVLDPHYEEGRYEEEGRKGLVEVKNGVIALCDIQTLADDSLNFYLFWRK